MNDRLTAPVDGVTGVSGPHALVEGAGRFVEDVTPDGLLHLVLVRSPLAHARISAIDVSAAAAVPGVAAVLTADELAAHGSATITGATGVARPVLARDEVVFQGQEVAAVVADTAYTAADAAQLVDVEYDPLPVVVDPFPPHDDGAAGPGEHPVTARAGDEDAVTRAFERAATVVTVDARYPRFHPSPLETCGCVADVDPGTGRLTLHVTAERDADHAALLAALGRTADDTEVAGVDIGGGFGVKRAVYPGYVAAVAASAVTGRPVRWAETRSEHLVSTTAAYDRRLHGALALGASGEPLAARLDLLADAGAFPAASYDALAGTVAAALGATYGIAHTAVTVRTVATNKAPIGARAGVHDGLSEAAFAVERLIDRAAAELGRDRADLRAHLLSAAGGAAPAAHAALATVRDRLAEVDAPPNGSPQAASRRGTGVAVLRGDAQGTAPRRPTIAVAVSVDVDRGTGRWGIRRLVLAHDAEERDGLRAALLAGVNDGMALAATTEVTFDEQGNCVGGTFMEYLLPTACEAPAVEVSGLDGHDRHEVGLDAAAAAAAAVVVPALNNAVVDALSADGVTDLPLPMTSGLVWEAARGHDGAE